MRIFALAVGLSVLTGCGRPVYIKAINDSDYDFEDLVYHQIEVGDLPSNTATTATEVDVAYDYTDVSFTIDGVLFEQIPIDYVGETPLRGGTWAYVIDVTDPASGVMTVTLSDETPAPR